MGFSRAAASAARSMPASGLERATAAAVLGLKAGCVSVPVLVPVPVGVEAEGSVSRPRWAVSWATWASTVSLGRTRAVRRTRRNCRIFCLRFARRALEFERMDLAVERRLSRRSLRS